MSAMPTEATDIDKTPAKHGASQVYSGETEVVFENDGQKVQAFEGFIEVPENRNNPDSRLIPVHYLRFPATGKQYAGQSPDDS